MIPLPQNAALLCAAMLLGLGSMLQLQPPPGAKSGRIITGCSFFLLWGDGRCWHLHHWILCCIAVMLMGVAVWGSGGACTPAMVTLVGLCTGAALSDLVYPDLSVSKSCFVRGNSESETGTVPSAPPA